MSLHAFVCRRSCHVVDPVVLWAGRWAFFLLHCSLPARHFSPSSRFPSRQALRACLCPTLSLRRVDGANCHGYIGHASGDLFTLSAKSHVRRGCHECAHQTVTILAQLSFTKPATRGRGRGVVTHNEAIPGDNSNMLETRDM